MAGEDTAIRYPLLKVIGLYLKYSDNLIYLTLI